MSKQNGSALLYIVIASAVVGTLSVAIMSTIVFGQKVSQRTQNSLETNNLADLIKLSLTSLATCNGEFVNLPLIAPVPNPPTSAQPLGTTAGALVTQIRYPSGAVMVAPGSTWNSRIQISRLEVFDLGLVDASPGQIRHQLALYLQTNDLGSRQMYRKEIYFFGDEKGAGLPRKIRNCAGSTLGGLQSVVYEPALGFNVQGSWLIQRYGNEAQFLAAPGGVTEIAIGNGSFIGPPGHVSSPFYGRLNPPTQFGASFVPTIGAGGNWTMSVALGNVGGHGVDSGNELVAFHVTQPTPNSVSFYYERSSTGAQQSTATVLGWSAKAYFIHP